ATYAMMTATAVNPPSTSASPPSSAAGDDTTTTTTTTAHTAHSAAAGDDNDDDDNNNNNKNDVAVEDGSAAEAMGEVAAEGVGDDFNGTPIVAKGNDEVGQDHD